MSTRRDFLKSTFFGTVGAVALSGCSIKTEPDLMTHTSSSNAETYKGLIANNETNYKGHYRPKFRLGLGGVAIGTGFAPVSTQDADATMIAAWNQGMRYFDTSPWYGLGLSERRMGHHLSDKKRDEFIISTKVGRVLKASEHTPETMWKAPSPFTYSYDYTASGIRRSIEDSLQRLGLSHLDIVFIHDLSADNKDLKEHWIEQFDVARKGAMKELTKLREEGVIKGWGLGVNTIEPCLRTLDVADPDVFLSATQYSLMFHEDALHRLFPKCEERGVSIVVGAPLNGGFLAGKDRYNYGPTIPVDIIEKHRKMAAIASSMGVDLRTAALQFSNAPRVVASVIPGASTGEQVKENIASFSVKIPNEFWMTLKREGLIAHDSPVPGS